MNFVTFKALGVVAFDERLFLAYVSPNNSPNTFRIDYSTNGVDFKKFSEEAHITGDRGKELVGQISKFRMVKTGEIYRLHYISSQGEHTYLCAAKSVDLVNWESQGHLFPLVEPATAIINYSHDEREVLFCGGEKLSIAVAEDSTSYNIQPAVLAAPSEKSPIDHYYIVGNAAQTPEGPLLTYFLRETHQDHVHFSIWSLLLDHKDPTKVLWRTNTPLWHQPQEWIGKPIAPVGITQLQGVYYSYWEWASKGIFCVVHTPFEHLAAAREQLPHAKLLRTIHNPIVAPNPENMWESKQVFNPAAVHHNGKVHLFYRAIGDGDTSVLGYTRSRDGLHFDERFDKPAYVPREDWEHPTPGNPIKTSIYESGGGGYGGIEDPRITKIGRRFYLTYIAHNGQNNPRIALSSISTDSFDKEDWSKWAKPVLISPPCDWQHIDKNACILPEKVNGKYVIFHRVYPDILIDFVDSLEDFDGESVWLKGEHAIHPRRDFWDSKKVGMGPPPIKTTDGWLAIYQAVGYQDQSKYKIGAMLLDLKDPTKVLYRSSRPVLEPEEAYENEGFKYGVVYPCGAVVLEGTLIIYYGGSDSFVAAATANLAEFLDQLKFDNSPHLDPINVEYMPNFNVEA